MSGIQVLLPPHSSKEEMCGQGLRQSERTVYIGLYQSGARCLVCAAGDDSQPVRILTQDYCMFPL
jgi:hypothetical protein